ncbi:MAG: hypothetical protein D6791_09075, partial [Chloroflexi bacterium]
MTLLPTLPRTKFLIPRPHPGTISRPHLVEELERHSGKRLILISTPPGYGKTTLLAEFARSTALPTTWCQLDATDSDPINFLTSFIQGLQHVRNQPEGRVNKPGLAALALLENSPDGAMTTVTRRALTVLINELVECMQGTWMVILEDYHEITNPAVHELVDHLVENAPPDLT